MTYVRTSARIENIEDLYTYLNKKCNECDNSEIFFEGIYNGNLELITKDIIQIILQKACIRKDNIFGSLLTEKLINTFLVDAAFRILLEVRDKIGDKSIEMNDISTVTCDESEKKTFKDLREGAKSLNPSTNVASKLLPKTQVTLTKIVLEENPLPSKKIQILPCQLQKTKVKMI